MNMFIVDVPKNEGQNSKSNLKHHEFEHSQELGWKESQAGT